MNSAAGMHEAAHGLVVSHPGIPGGKPVFRGTRLLVATWFQYLADGLTLDYFLKTFPSIQRDQATRVLRYGLSRSHLTGTTVRTHCRKSVAAGWTP